MRDDNFEDSKRNAHLFHLHGHSGDSGRGRGGGGRRDGRRCCGGRSSRWSQRRCRAVTLRGPVSGVKRGDESGVLAGCYGRVQSLRESGLDGRSGSGGPGGRISCGHDRRSDSARHGGRDA